MTVKEIIELIDCPEKLQKSVADYLESMPAAEVLSVQKVQTTPYKDKTIIDTSYKVFTLVGNYFCVHKLSLSSNPEWSREEVSKSCMIAGEIQEIVNLSPEWFTK